MTVTTTRPGEALLELEGVTRTYGTQVKVHALRDVSLTIGAGDFVSIVGPSGSGKSTMLGLLGCLDLPSEGVIRVGGVDVTTLDDADRSKLRGDSIGFVFQQFHLIPHLTTLGNVETALLYRDMKPGARRKRAMFALEQVGLAERAHHRPVQMSGGEQQRVAIAPRHRDRSADGARRRADRRARHEERGECLGHLPALQSAERAVVIVTHDIGVADAAERRVSMRDGEIVGDERRAPRLAP